MAFRSSVRRTSVASPRAVHKPRARSNRWLTGAPCQAMRAPFMPPTAADALLASDNERPAAPSASTTYFDVSVELSVSSAA